MLSPTDFLDLGVPDHLDLGVLEQPLLQDALGAELTAPVDRSVTLDAKVGEEQRFFERQCCRRRRRRLPCRGRRSHRRWRRPRRRSPGTSFLAVDDRASLAWAPVAMITLNRRCSVVAAIADERRRAGLSKSTSTMMSLTNLRADMLGLGLHLLHEPGALDDVGKAGIVFDIGGDGQLAAGLQTGDHYRLQHCPRRVDRGRIAPLAPTQ